MRIQDGGSTTTKPVTHTTPKAHEPAKAPSTPASIGTAVGLTSPASLFRGTATSRISGGGSGQMNVADPSEAVNTAKDATNAASFAKASAALKSHLSLSWGERVGQMRANGGLFGLSSRNPDGSLVGQSQTFSQLGKLGVGASVLGVAGGAFGLYNGIKKGNAWQIAQSSGSIAKSSAPLASAGINAALDSGKLAGTAADVAGSAAKFLVPGANIAGAAISDAKFASDFLPGSHASSGQKVFDGITAAGATLSATNIPVVSQIGGVIAAGSIVAQNFKPAMEVANTVGNAIGKGVGDAEQTVTHAADDVGHAASSAAHAVSSFVSSIF